MASITSEVLQDITVIGANPYRVLAAKPKKWLDSEDDDFDEKDTKDDDTDVEDEEEDEEDEPEGDDGIDEGEGGY